jgi:ADP-ribose pyrophosphatase
VIKRVDEVAVTFDAPNPWIEVYYDVVEFPGGVRGRYSRIVERGGRGVAVLPHRNGQIALLRIYRYPISAEVLEAPRGFGEGADPAVDARRELLEETGFGASSLVDLGELHANSGLLAASTALFLAQVDDADPAPADGEAAEVRWVDVVAVEAMIASGRITDAFTIAAFCRARLRHLL